MSSKAGFSVQELFGIVTVAAVLFASLASPSAKWALPLAILSMGVVAYGIQRAVISPASRPFWLSYFGALLLFVAVMIGHRLTASVDPFTFHVSMPVWLAIHGDEPRGDQSRYETFLHFTFCLRLMLAIMLPAVIAYTATFFSRDAQSP